MVDSAEPTILHLDHTTERGGAEYALLRILLANHAWRGVLALPRPRRDEVGIYTPLVKLDTSIVRFIGPAQLPGAVGVGARLKMTLAVRALGQSLAIRASKTFHVSDVVHANTSRAAVYAAVACLSSRKTLVIHLRDHVDENSLGRIGFFVFTRLVLKRANGVIANSDSTLASARPFMGENILTTVIPSAIGIQTLPSFRDEPKGDNYVTIGMVSRIDPWKGQDLVLRAFAQAAAGKNVRLVFAGEAAFGHDDYRTELLLLAEALGIADQVAFVGHVQDVFDLIAGFDVCVHASRRAEPLGQNVLQYLAAGRPIIATRQGGPGEWITDDVNGLLFDMGDVDALAGLFVKTVEGSSLRARLAEGARNTRGLRTDEEIAADHGEFFGQCLAQGRKNRRAY